MDAINSAKSCLIVGAGIAGLLAARALQERGVRVTLLDKGRGVGGRMATRRIGSAVFDHGAQFFTARDPRFGAVVDDWLSAQVSEEWCRGFADHEGLVRGDGHPRYRGSTGMTAVPKYLALGLDVRLGQRVTTVEAYESRWMLTTEQGTKFTADALLLTAPVPQSVALLNAGAMQLPSGLRQALDAIQYDPCIALMVQPSICHLPAPGGMQLSEGPIVWIGDNRQKRISPEAAVTIHATAEFSRKHWGSDDREIVSLLMSAAAPWVSEPISDVHVHRWRYARPSALHPDRCLAISEPLPLAFAGDAFGEPRVEGAALSGMAAAHALLGD